MINSLLTRMMGCVQFYVHIFLLINNMCYLGGNKQDSRETCCLRSFAYGQLGEDCSLNSTGILLHIYVLSGLIIVDWNFGFLGVLTCNIPTPKKFML